VLELLAADASTAEIALRLAISQVTVRRHVSSLLRKLGAADRAGAVALLRQRSAG
jgi:DNA-binding CsgD family transcriptional regulator